jgi:hypothetical protein
VAETNAQTALRGVTVRSRDCRRPKRKREEKNSTATSHADGSERSIIDEAGVGIATMPFSRQLFDACGHQAWATTWPSYLMPEALSWAFWASILLRQVPPPGGGSPVARRMGFFSQVPKGRLAVGSANRAEHLTQPKQKNVHSSPPGPIPAAQAPSDGSKSLQTRTVNEMPSNPDVERNTVHGPPRATPRRTRPAGTHDDGALLGSYPHCRTLPFRRGRGGTTGVSCLPICHRAPRRRG